MTVALKMRALAAAMEAKCGVANQGDITILAEAAENLPENDSLKQAIDDFVVAARRRAIALVDLRQAGDHLHTAVLLSNIPTPPNMDRADIYG